MWELDFISEQDFTNHVKATIEKYGEKLQSFDLERFNKNLIDPIKLVFDKTVYRSSWDETISNEIFRQRDKSNNNDIGYFHQRIFQYIPNCHVPQNGTEGGWDVIYRNPNGIALPDGSVVHSIYVEMKNKHNTMNSSAAGKTFIKMQHQILSNQFYALVTGEENAFYKVCMALPEVIQKVVASSGSALVPSDTVMTELRNLSSQYQIEEPDLSIAMAVYMLGFSTYNGFSAHPLSR